MNQPVSAEAEACSNIALIKYWGKLDRPGNYPAVPSLSLTLSGLATTTRVELDDRLKQDEVELDAVTLDGRPRLRVVGLLDAFRQLAKRSCFARVTSRNGFPTASGLASSASGFAALVTAANAAFGIDLDRVRLSALARSASASAARSLFGGWSELLVGADAAAEIAPTSHWPLVMLVAVTTAGKKSIGSTEAMNLTRSTSPYYAAWLAHAQELFDRARCAVLERDFHGLGATMEQSTLMMHATMLAACPAVIYWTPATLHVMREVENLRASNVPCYFTIDAGPHVKVLCQAADANRIHASLLALNGVVDVLVGQPGPGAKVRAAR